MDPIHYGKFHCNSVFRYRLETILLILVLLLISRSSNGSSTWEQPRCVVQAGHTNGCRCLAFSPDGAILATGGLDASIRLWNVKSGLLLRTLWAQTAKVHSLSFNADGSLIASGGDDGTLVIWNTRNGTKLRTFRRTDNEEWLQLFESNPIDQIAFVPDQSIFVRYRDRALLSWSIERTKPKVLIPGNSVSTIKALLPLPYQLPSKPNKNEQTSRHTGSYIKRMRSLLFPAMLPGYFPFNALSQNGEYVAFVLPQNKKCGLISFRDWKQYFSVPPSGIEEIVALDESTTRGLADIAGFLWLVDFSDSHLLLQFQIDQGFLNNKITISSLDISRAMICSESNGSRYAAAFSPNGLTVAICDKYGLKDRIVFLYSTKSGKCIGSLQGHTGSVMAMAYSPDGSTIATASDDKTVRLWDTTSGQVKATLGTEANIAAQTVTFSGQGNKLAVGMADGGCRIWSLNVLAPVVSLKGKSDAVMALSFNSDSTRLLSNTDNGLINIWRTSDWQKVTSIATGTKWAQSAAFYSGSHDTKIAIGSAHPMTASVWDITLRKKLFSYGSDSDIYFEDDTCMLSSDGQILAIGKGNGTILLFSLKHKKPIGTISAYQQYTTPDTSDRYIWSMCFSPDNQVLATTSDDNLVKLWSSSSHHLIRALKGHRAPVTAVAYDYLGRLIATGSEDHEVRIWNKITGNCIEKYDSNASAINAVSFQPRGHLLASAGQDGAVVLWDLDNHKELCRLISYRDGNWAVVAPDGRFEASSLDHTNNLHWVIPNEPLDAFKLAIFERQYYEPRLLSRILAKNAGELSVEDDFATIPSLANVNRVQPEVTIKNVKLEDQGIVSITVTVANIKQKALWCLLWV